MEENYRIEKNQAIKYYLITITIFIIFIFEYVLWLNFLLYNANSNYLGLLFLYSPLLLFEVMIVITSHTYSEWKDRKERNDFIRFSFSTISLCLMLIQIILLIARVFFEMW